MLYVVSTKRSFRQVQVSNFILDIRCEVAEWLDNEVRRQTSLVETFLHTAHALQAHRRPEVTVYAHHRRTC